MRHRLLLSVLFVLLAAGCAAPQSPDRPVLCPTGVQIAELTGTVEAGLGSGVGAEVDFDFEICGIPVDVSASVDDTGHTTGCVIVPLIGQHCVTAGE